MVDSGVSELKRLKRVALNHRLPKDNLDSLKPDEQLERLRGMLNQAFFASAENWMKPSWALLDTQGGKDEDTLNNNTHRNCIVIGTPGGQKFGRCDESGLLSGIRKCGSIEFWLQDGKEIIFPSMLKENERCLSLISPDDQIYDWNMSVGPIDFSRLIYHVDIENSEIIINEIHISNRLLEPANFTFYVAIRPLSYLGVEPIESIVYDENSGNLYTNDCLASIFHQQPNAVYMSTADDPNLVRLITSEQIRIDHDYTTNRGLATAVIRYDLKLGPAESHVLYVSNPLDEVTQNDLIPEISPNSKFRIKTIQSWFEFSRKTMGLEIPDDTLQTAYAQAKASLTIQALDEFKTIPTKGQSVFWRERVRILLALLRIGCSDVVKMVISNFIENDERAETKYEFSIISPLVWMLIQYVNYNNDIEYFEKQSSFVNSWFETILESLQNLFDDSMREEHGLEPELEIKTDKEPPEIETIEETEPSPEPEIAAGEGTSDSEISEERKLSPEHDTMKDENGTPPPFESSEQPEPQDIDKISLGQLWTPEELLRLMWNCETIRKLSKILRKGDEPEISEVLAKCETLILEKLEELSFEPLEALDILSSISLFNIVHFSREQTDNLLLKLDNKILKNGLVTISPLKKLFSSHHALRVGHYYCLTNQRYMVEDLLFKATEFLSEFHLLPEYVNVKTKGGSAGDGCSIIAAADMILLLRDLLIYESGEDLVLLSGIPEEWYSSPTPIIASAIRTKHGEVSIEIGTSANQHQIEINMTSPPQEIEVHVPHSFSMPMVKVFGAGIANRNGAASSPHIRIVPLSESVVLTAHK